MQKTDGDPVEKAQIALTKFNRLSASEVVTPPEVRDILVKGITKKRVTNDAVFFYIASKQGELTIAFLNNNPTFNKHNCYSVATSTVAYEMTRKVYSALGIPVKNVLLPPKPGDGYYDELLKTINDGLQCSPNIVLCCPPFQKPKGGGRGDGGSDIYPYYFNLCKRLNPNNEGEASIPFIFGMYTKATWNTQGTQLPDETVVENEEESTNEDGEINASEFRKQMLSDKHISALNDYLNAKPFYEKGQAVTLRGGVTIFFWDAKEHELPRVSLFIDKDHLQTTESRKLLPSYLKKLMLQNRIVNSNNPDFPYVRIGGLGYSIMSKVLKKAHKERIAFLKVCPRNVFKITENVEKSYRNKPVA